MSIIAPTGWGGEKSAKYLLLWSSCGKPSRAAIANVSHSSAAYDASATTATTATTATKAGRVLKRSERVPPSCCGNKMCRGERRAQENEARESKHHFPKKRWVNVAIKLTSTSRPITASRAANPITGLSKLVTPGPGKKPRPWNEVTL